MGPKGLFSLPRWRGTRWLTEAGKDVPPEIRRALIASLHGTLPIFAGGVFNSILIAGIVAARLGQPLLIAWFVAEIVIGVARLAVLVISFRRAEAGQGTPTDVYLLLSVVWAASVGYGASICVLSGDWISATIACMSAAAMVGGICFRNFAAPRLVALMIALSLGPICLVAPFSGEPAMLAALVQIPFYLISMRLAAYRLNGLLVNTMEAERENDRRARHDALTGLSNRDGLTQAVDAVSRGERHRLALLYLDLDGFKAVNDTYGHTAGDRLLKAAAARLKGLLRAGDVAARIGGDEFVIIARDVERAQAPAFGERLIREVGAPYDLGNGMTVTIGVSVGVALTPHHGEELPELLQVADAALYQAKLAGKSRCVIATDRDFN